jgi:hypothetical protein
MAKSRETRLGGNGVTIVRRLCAVDANSGAAALSRGRCWCLFAAKKNRQLQLPLNGAFISTSSGK